MELLIDRGGNIDDDVEVPEVRRAVWRLGQVYIRIRGVISVEVSVHPTLTSATALAEAQRWIACLTPDEVVLHIEEGNGIKETFSNYADAIQRLEFSDS
jgi:hypothetical protein